MRLTKSTWKSLPTFSARPTGFTPPVAAREDVRSDFGGMLGHSGT